MKWPLLVGGLVVGTGLGFVAGVYAVVIAACTWPNVVPSGWIAEMEKEAS